MKSKAFIIILPLEFYKKETPTIKTNNNVWKVHLTTSFLKCNIIYKLIKAYKVYNTFFVYFKHFHM